MKRQLPTHSLTRVTRSLHQRVSSRRAVQVEWLRSHVQRVPVRLVFESSLELMESTQVGGFKMAPGGKSKGPPPAVKKVLSLFGSGREEDKMVGYLSFLKIGPKLLKYLPGKLAPRGWSCAVGPGVAFAHQALCARLHCLPIVAASFSSSNATALLVPLHAFFLFLHPQARK